MFLCRISVGFLREYADKCHHGKEEDILFKGLKSKNLSDGHREILQRLIDEHSAARAAVKKLESASAENNRAAALESMKFLSWLYPKHIELEDRHFFIPVMDYFTEDEQQKMVGEFFEFDRNIIHNKYRKIAEELEKRK